MKSRTSSPRHDFHLPREYIRIYLVVFISAIRVLALIAAVMMLPIHTLSVVVTVSLSTSPISFAQL